MVFKIADTYNYRQLWWLDKLLIGHKGYIAGGCFKNIFNNERVKDVDIFFENKADCLEAISYYKNYDNVDEENYMAVFEIIFHEDFFEHLHTKRLVIDDEMIYPVSTFNRVMRYARYGYQPCRETKIKIVTNLAMLDPKNQKDFEKELGKSLYDGLD